LDQLGRARKDFFDKLSDQLGGIKGHAVKIRKEGNTGQADIIDEFARRIYGYKNTPGFDPKKKPEKEREEEKPAPGTAKKSRAGIV